MIAELDISAATQASDIWQTYVGVLRPMEELLPDAFAEKYRILHEVYCSERPGKWDNSVFPYQGPAMNCIAEAIRTGKRGVVLMKAGQIGGTDLMINGDCWLKCYYPGPQLFMTSTEKVAAEFGRERFESIIRDMPPLFAKYIPNRRGDILTKRFVDGKIQLSGGQSVFNLQSTPYRFVTIDELDSLQENLGGEGDPLKLAEVRTDSFSGQTLILAYAHPTTLERGAARLYYLMSDQRRAFVRHDPPHCGAEFYFKWEDVKCTGDAGDPDNYHYLCPQCGSILSDEERCAMMRAGIIYKSTLPPEEARRKRWIGIQAGQLLLPQKTIRSFAERWIDCGGASESAGAENDNEKRVFFNKTLGEPFEPKVKKIDLAALRSLIVIQRRAKDPEFFSRGQVPPGVRFLTAGQDSRAKEFHYAVWGWGLRRLQDQTVRLCGWLIDWGVIERQYSLTFTESEYHVFDALIYRKIFPASLDGAGNGAGAGGFQVVQCGHDIGYQPTQIPLIRFCRNHPRRAIPVRGASLTPTSASTAPYARWGHALKFKAARGDELADETSQALILNTFMLKTDWYGWIDRGPQALEVPDVDEQGKTIGLRKVGQICLPEDVDEEFLQQSRNEELKKGKRKGELVWTRTGPNHWADCNTYALGLALNLDPFQKNLTADEFRKQNKQAREQSPPAAGGRGEDRRWPRDDPAMG